MKIDEFRRRLSKTALQAHVTELGERGAFLVFFEQGSFQPEISPDELSQIDGVIAVERKSAASPYIYRVTVDKTGNGEIQ